MFVVDGEISWVISSLVFGVLCGQDAAAGALLEASGGTSNSAQACCHCCCVVRKRLRLSFALLSKLLLYVKMKYLDYWVTRRHSRETEKTRGIFLVDSGRSVKEVATNL